MKNFWVWFSGIGILSGIIAAFSINPAIADIIPDTTLPNNSQVTKEVNTINIDGGTRLSDSNNLFHSFQDFSVPQGFTAYFRNPDVKNIITRVTGNSRSNIEGVLKANGAANLFLINPNGIVFGPSAALDIGGSFITSTASSINFQNGAKFSATYPQFTPLLAVSVPVGLQFGRTAAEIRNQSQAGPSANFGSNSGLRVRTGQTIALVGGNITLDGGIITAQSGRIELGSVGPNSLVSLNPENAWSLGYENSQIFQDIRLRKHNDFQSVLDTSSNFKNPIVSGSIHLKGNWVEISGDQTTLRSFNMSEFKGGDIEIYARRIEAKEGSQITTTTLGAGASGNLIVNASESVELIGGNNAITGFFTTTADRGSAGDIKIITSALRIKDGASISAGYGASESSPVSLAGSSGGNITVKADIVEVSGFLKGSSTFSSELSTSTTNYGNVGKIDITTKELIVRNGGLINVVNFLSDENLSEVDASQVGTPGELKVNARSIVLDNKAQLTAKSGIGQGGNITLNVKDLLLMRGGSQITTSAGQRGGDGNGGNITINTPNGFVVATPLGNNDITANADFGSGGKIAINAQRIFGLVPRTRAELVRLLRDETPETQDLPTSDITAFSRQNPSLNGIIQINTPDVDPGKGLSELTEETVDASRQIDRGCGVSGSRARSTFTFTGRGGLVSNPLEPLTSEGVLTNWIVLEDGGQNLTVDVRKGAEIHKLNGLANVKQESNFVNNPELIVEAQSWVIDANGKVVLVAQDPNVEQHSLSFNSASCLAR
ncbi:MAG TPA: filamentous hemagglutinin N-terminal domain-containing protein [Nostocaceae cyanobacterium]|nr:filamentous hemagglutinin N-terminal domain-containing protein [Nostocaceae cyanobacterium]